MASTQTHFAVATSVCGAAATSMLAAGLATAPEALIYLTAGVVGGNLPDIDADNSKPLKTAFHWGALALASFALVQGPGHFSALELGATWLFVYLAVRVVAVRIFERLTVHRGLFHSLPAAACFAALTTFVAARGLGREGPAAWWAGLFCFGGYVSHLLVDEWQGLNLFGVGVRKSLGSALKPWSRSNPRGALFLYVLATALALSAPSPRPFVDTLTSMETYRTIYTSLLPKGPWFSLTQHPGAER